MEAISGASRAAVWNGCADSLWMVLDQYCQIMTQTNATDLGHLAFSPSFLCRSTLMSTHLWTSPSFWQPTPTAPLETTITA